MDPVGLYLHIPFCLSKCRYCDFYSLPSLERKDDFVRTVLEEIRSYEGGGLSADTLYLGGGTPSALPGEALGEIFAACREVFGLAGECTIEANPDSASDRWLSLVREAGFNRISFGAQSMIDAELAFLGRLHNADGVRAAVLRARRAGFDNLSLDLMAGIPYQTAESLNASLEAMLELEPEHLSCYLLKVEENTPFDRPEIRALCAGEDQAADFYLQIGEKLGKAGFVHYEISNFAREGFESRHNLKYWQGKDYLGFGPAAHSCFGGRRFYHPRSLLEYLETKGQNRVDDGAAGSPEERVMLGLRLKDGVAKGEIPLSARDPAAFEALCQRLVQAGYIHPDRRRVALTEKGFLLSNAVIGALLA